MVAVEPSSAVLGTSELRSYILDFLHDSKEDLQSCALVSRAFTFPAQSHLFHHIKIGVRFHDRNASIRLSEIMDAAPHLRPFVRHVTAVMDPVMLTRIHGMNLPNVRRLNLYSDSPSTIDVLALRVARDLLSCQSLHTLHIDAGFPDYAALNLLFERRSPSLHTLQLCFVTVLEPETSDPLTAAITVRTEIIDLRLKYTSAAIAAWLLRPQCPLGLTQLRKLVVYDSLSPALVEALEAARASLEVLYLMSQDDYSGLSLAAFAALTELCLLGPPHDLIPVIGTLPPTGGILGTLTFITRTLHPGGPSTAVSTLELIDLLLSRMELPALARIELRVLLAPGADPSATNATNAEITAKVTGAFVHMHRRGVLVMENFQGPWE
ncbi:hypothetical protein FB451DRAFT_1255304 [Mycena latifolia]|nr:hypothetical protein FB451DRAFT_1255304 [Mycena latifolia]